MVTAADVINSIKPNLTKVPRGQTRKGSAGYDNIRDDIEKTKSLREGSIQKVPVNTDDITNKTYVDSEILAQLEDGTSTGQVAFWNGTKWVHTETNEVVWDDTNKRVGIGTTEPDTLLHVGNTANVGNTLTIEAATYPRLSLKRGNQEWITMIDTSGAYLITDVTENEKRMVIDTDGNVGIGTTSPEAGYKLTIQQATSASEYIAGLQNDGSTKAFTINADAENATWMDLYDSSGNIDIRLYTAGNSYFNSGNVGIGTGSPSKKLDVDIGSTAADGYQLSFNSGTASSEWRVVNPGVDNTAEFGTVNNNDLALITYGTERMRILTSTGNVGIGTTDPQNTLNVVGTGNFTSNLSVSNELNMFYNGTEMVIEY